MTNLIDCTALLALANVLHTRLLLLGYRALQPVDDTGADSGPYFIVPSTAVIPAGHCLIGSDPRRDPAAPPEEMPQQRLWLPTYRMARYPLTLAEYACYLAATQAQPPFMWDECDPAHCGDLPVSELTWREAANYAAWLCEMTGTAWRLPTEAEWEKAARGPYGDIYPWGDSFVAGAANTSEMGDALSPVGAYPAGISPYGIFDMAGNVWEWTATTPEGPDRDYNPANEADEFRLFYRRVLRGGSCTETAWVARAAARKWEVVDAANGLMGTRLVIGNAGDFPATRAELNDEIEGEYARYDRPPPPVLNSCLISRY